MNYLCLFVCSSALFLAGCRGQSSTAAAKQELPVRPVWTAPVETGDRVDRVEVIGELQGIEEIRVFAQVAERIHTLAVKEGMAVRKGDLIATVLGDLQTEALRQAEAALEAAVANRDVVHDNLVRTRVLLEGGGGTRGQLETLEAQARASEAQVRQATAAVNSASAYQGRTTVRSPTSGVVAQLSVKVGDQTSPTVPLATIVKDDRVKAVLRVPERDFLRIRTGMSAKVSPLARPELAVEGQVTLRGPIVDRITRTGLVEVHLPNPERLLLAGSTIRVSIEIARRTGVVLVPAEAVLLTGETERSGLATVFVAEGDQARRREITVGVRQGNRFEVIRGLDPGEQLIVRGAHLLRDGNPITRQVREPGEES